MNKKEAQRIAKSIAKSNFINATEVTRCFGSASDGITQYHTLPVGKRGGLMKPVKLGKPMRRGDFVEVTLPYSTIVRRDNTINGWTNYSYFIHGVGL